MKKNYKSPPPKKFFKGTITIPGKVKPIFPASVAGRLQAITELLKQGENCVCEKCGDEHKNGPGPLAGLNKKEFKKLWALFK